MPIIADARPQICSPARSLATWPECRRSILNSPEQNRHAFDPPYEANDLVALAFARYPYPEFFFGWTPSSGGTVMFARTDRLPAWITPHHRADVYPVEVRRDPPEIAALRQRVESDVAARRRYSVFDMSIRGTPYQVVALLAYEGATRERLDRVFGVAVNLDWARDHYFNDILQQVAQIAGNAGAASFAVIDEQGRRVAGTLEPVSRQTVATRVFPVLFFDPTLLAVNPPADLTQRSWTIAASAAGDPTFVLAARGARRSLVVVGAGVALLALSLLATARAARASAAVAAVRADFVATVTHELKTPLSTITGGRRDAGARTRQNRPGPEPVRAPARARGAAPDAPGEQPARLFARDRRDRGLFVRGSGTGSAHFRSDARIPPAADRQRRSARNRCAADVPAVRADRTAIVLALDNLIDNAIRYSGEAETVSVRASSEADHVRFDVIDHGVGIPADDLPQVKRRFVRGKTTRGPGNGLGLAIVNRIAADHDGALEITSEVGRGTTATLILPKAAIECGQES